MKFLSLLFTIAFLRVSIQSDAVDRFSAKIYRELKETKAGNFAVSPISAQIVLALAHQAAEGQTAQQLSLALELPEDKTAIQRIFGRLTSDLQESGDYYLGSANKVYVANGYRFTPFFKEVAAIFNSEVGNIDFIKPQAFQQINKWVEQKSNNTIRNLASQHDFDATTRSVFINALSFKGVWQQEFDERTYTREFYVDRATQRNFEVMQVDGKFKFAESKPLNAKFLELPFEGEDVTMTFVLPNDKDGLPALENNVLHTLTFPEVAAPRISSTVIDPFDEDNDKTKRRVLVEIPKFTVDTSVEFKGILEKLGVRKAFTDQAEFPNLVESGKLAIDNMLQKTYLDVHEKGVTATAATKITFHDLSRPGNTFFAHHPFLYYIKAKGMVLFVGRFVSP